MSPLTPTPVPPVRRKPRRGSNFLSGSLLTAVAAAGLWAAPSAPAMAALTCSSKWQYAYTGAPECFQVPAGVSRLTVDAYGAQGGAGGGKGGGAMGGLGGRTTTTMTVKPGQNLYVSVGGQGHPGSEGNDSYTDQGAGAAGGWGERSSGGQGDPGDPASGYAGGGGGGGASDVRWGMTGTTEERLVVAAGGGGGGGHTVGTDQPGMGGSGGGVNGANGRDNYNNSVTHRGEGGYGATATAPGSGPGDAGYQGKGGMGTPISAMGSGYGGAGGGGGGWFGGAGGLGTTGGYDGPGGGGGSSYAADTAGSTLAGNVRYGDGKVVLSAAASDQWSLSTSPYQPLALQPLQLSVNYGPGVGGSVHFTSNGGSFGVGKCDGEYPVVNGVATCTFQNYLGVGDYKVDAIHSGFTSSDPSVLSITPGATITKTIRVKARTGTQLSTSATPVISGQSVVFKATVTPYGTEGWASKAMPTGWLRFYDTGRRYLGVAELQRIGTSLDAQATFTATTDLTIGTHSITAEYWANDYTTSSTSAPLSQVVLGGTLNNSAAGITYTGSWTNYVSRPTADGSDYGNDIARTTTAGDSFAYTFVGTGISWVSQKGWDQEVAHVYLDGSSQGLVSGQGQFATQQTLYDVSGLTNGHHTLKVVNATNAPMTLDALVIR